MLLIDTSSPDICSLDKGLNQLANRMGKPQSRGTIEKVSDGIRKAFKKATGKDVPIKDQEYK